ncbi:MAG: hypothetical protein ABI612_17325 [Betaproteobacteria bacterium]
MLTEEKEKGLIELLEGFGVSMVKSMLKHDEEAFDIARKYGISPADFKKSAWVWIEQKEDERREALEARRAAETKQAIDAARRSAFWTMIAAIAAAASVFVPLLIALIERLRDQLNV